MMVANDIASKPAKFFIHFLARRPLRGRFDRDEVWPNKATYKDTLFPTQVKTHQIGNSGALELDGDEALCAEEASGSLHDGGA